MENVGITGFDNEKPNLNTREIIVRMADCGSSKLSQRGPGSTYVNKALVSSPGTREISSLTYRSPEVYFGKPWDQSTDIWSWGIMASMELVPI